MKKILTLVLCFCMLFSLAACAIGDGEGKKDDVIVLFTNDVHGALDDAIGYAGLSAYKKEMTERYRHVVLVDCGDFTQGTYEGTVSKGELLVDLTNEVGYDFCIFGNHEFDYGLEQLRENVKRSSAHFLSTNVRYTGDGENWMEKETKPYEIVTYGKIRVAFLGVTTPKTLTDSSSTRFMENGEIVCDFAQGDGGARLYQTVQENVDECRAKGADYVVVLSHLGMDREADAPYTSLDLAENTRGIDVILDGHSHTQAACWIRSNKDGQDVLLSSTGSYLETIGKLVLTPDGTASVGYIDAYEKKDPEITQKIAALREDYEKMMNTVVAHIDFDLSIRDADGIRMVRTREIPIGDLVADAYRILGQADIGLCNGGGISNDFKAGDITYRDIFAVCPRGNKLCVVKVTGAELLDMMEYFYRKTQPDYRKDGQAWGEEGSFQQVSGLKFSIRTSVETSIEVDENDFLLGVGDTRRVADVMVLKDGVYVPLDPQATYTVASHDYMIKQGGSGMLHYLEDHELVIDESIPDYQVVAEYIQSLGENIEQYRTAGDRIRIE